MFKVKTFIDIVGANLDDKINSVIQEIEEQGGIIRDVQTQIYGTAAEKIIVIITYIAHNNIFISQNVDVEEDFEPFTSNEEILPNDVTVTFPPEWNKVIVSKIPQ